MRRMRERAPLWEIHVLSNQLEYGVRHVLDADPRSIPAAASSQLQSQVSLEGTAQLSEGIQVAR